MATPTPIEAELASRLLSRRRFLPFVKRINPNYDAGWVHEDICRRLEKFSDDVANKKSPRLMLLMPPRSGKSELGSRSFPPWHLGRHPDHEIIACSYNVGLAMSFSRKVKDVINDAAYYPVFPVRLNPDFQGAEEWGLQGSAGGYVAAGVGGGITGKGAHCVIPYCTIDTIRGMIPASQLKVGDPVYGYSHESGHVVQTTVIAVSVTPRTKAAVRCGAAVLTDDHPVFAGGAYRPAHAAQGLPGVWLTEGTTRTHVQDLLFEVEGTGPGGADMRLLSEEVHAAAGGASEIHEPPRRGSTHVLFSNLLQRLQEAASRALQHIPRNVRGMRQAARGQGAEKVLFPHLLHITPGDQPVYGQLRSSMAGDQVSNLTARQGMYLVRGPEVTDGGTPRGSQSGEPGHEEPDIVVHAVPQEISCVHGTCAKDLAGLLHTADYVVDFQTGTGNFFAGGLLVHNCLIIDDPIKNAEEADSSDNRDKLKEWYDSTAYTRLAPGGGVLCVQTWWHDDDLAGRLQVAMAADPYADQFVVVKYPAIAETDEYLDYDSDLIVSEPPENGKLLRLKGEALHPARYDIDKLNQIKRTISPRFWSALYQQNPVPDDGAYFLKEHFKRSPLPHITRSKVFIAWDFAISEKKLNDYTVGTVLLQDEDDTLHVAEVVRFKSGDALYIVDAILNLSKRWYTSGQIVGFEDGQIYRALESLLKKRMRERQQYISTQVLKPITDKLARARPLQGRMQQGRVSFATEVEWYDACRLEMLRFPAGAHDDFVDSASWAVQLAIGSEPPRRAQPKEPASWRDKLRHNHTGSFMSA